MEGDDSYTAAPAQEFPEVPEVVKSAGQGMNDAAAFVADKVGAASESVATSVAASTEGAGTSASTEKDEGAGFDPMKYVPKVSLPVSASTPVTTLNDVIYWKNPLVTGVLFATFNVVFMLVLFGGFSFLRVFCSAAMFYLLVGLIVVNGSKLLVGFTEKARIPEPKYGQEYIVKSIWIPRVEKAIAALNKVLDVVVAALYCVNNKRTLQLFGVFYLLSWVGYLIPDAVLIYLVGLAVFTGPVVYKNYKEEIDVHLEKIKKLIEDYYVKGKAMAEEKAVELKKVADVKMAELKTQVQQKSQPLLEQSGVAKKFGLSPGPKKTE